MLSVRMFMNATLFNQKIATKPQQPVISSLLAVTRGKREDGSVLPKLSSWQIRDLSKFIIEKGWDTKNVLDMSDIFNGATSFNQPVGGLDTSKVTDMHKMFYEATSFNQPVEGLNTSNVQDMSYMFSRATSFNQPVEELDTSKVVDMEDMFVGTTAMTYNIIT